MKFKIDDEFRDRLPPLREQEYAELKADIAERGVIDPLTIWGEAGVLLDGHNRYAIAKELGVGFECVSVSLRTRGAALAWIDRHQLRRRNLAPDVFNLVLGRVYNAEKAGYGGARDQNGPLTRTADRVAREFNVGSMTVKRAGKDAELLDKHPTLANQVIRGEKRLREARMEAGGPSSRQKSTGPKRHPTPGIGKIITNFINQFRGIASMLASFDVNAACEAENKDDLCAQIDELMSALRRVKRDLEAA